MTRHHLVRWEERFGERGLAIVEISGGELASLEESRQHFGRGPEPLHPVLWDRENQNHKRYGITSWPAAYLIGADGRVFWQGNPERMETRPAEKAEFERLLEEQLQRATAAKR